MSDAWMPGIRYVRAGVDGGPLKGGAPRAVWNVLGADPQRVSARSAAQHLDQGGYPSHLVWNPHNGEIVQLIPIIRAACALSSADRPQSASWAGGGRDGNVNAEGRVCAQICVVAQADEPFTAGPMVGSREILTWLDSWGIPRSWPAGQPAPFPECHATVRSRRLWARGGHFGASQVPGLTATGPGAIDPERLTGRSAAKTAHLAPAAAGGFDPPDLGELLGARSALTPSLTRLH